jgi:3-oxoacyl-[acyl-carrier-protein] synthase II
MEAYIDGRSAISPQNTFSGENSFDKVREYENVHFMKCIEPQYNALIDPMASRRMSRIMKMSMASALKCLDEAGVRIPDAIVTGTGLGCLEDTEKFLGSLISNEEKLLNPTPFIQSTHNTIAANIAIFLKCHGYNNTFSHRGFSFESALLDSLMLLEEGSVNNVLVGGVDELTASSFIITNRLNFWKKEPVRNLSLLDYNSEGSLAGEGAAFFTLKNHKTNHSAAKILSVSTFYKPEGIAVIEKKLSALLTNEPVEYDQPDLVLMGLSGDRMTDRIYYHLKDTLFRNAPCAYFKHLSGEYDTSSSFALYIASGILKEQKLPEIIRLDDRPINRIRKILIYNHLRNSQHSVIILSSC